MANEFTLNVAGMDGPVTFPGDTDPATVHSALVSHVNPPDNIPGFVPQPDTLPVQTTQPMAAGAIENSVPFRLGAQAAWNATAQGRAKKEAAFPIHSNGLAGALQQAYNSGGGEVDTKIPDDATAVVHTHPDSVQDNPSKGDIASAKKWGHPIYVVSRSGLWGVDGKGNVNHVYSDPDWMNKPVGKVK